MSDYLPPEIVQQLLLRLPIKSLVRFTSVCKSWHNLITSPEFISAHLNFTKSRNNSTHLLIDYSSMEKNENGMGCYRGNYVLCSDGTDGALQESVRLDLEPEGGSSALKSLRVVGSCNGLICLSNICCITFSGDPEQVVIIWNPMIRRSLHLPKSDAKFESEKISDSIELRLGKSPDTFGFGFDHVSNDYKVLRIYSWGELPAIIEIYRLSTGLWEDITYKAPFHQISGRTLQADRKGIAHWIGEDNNNQLKIVTFDMHGEVFGSLELPVAVASDDEICGEQDWEKYTFVFGDSLFLIRRVPTGEVSDEDDDYNDRQFERKFDLWRMEEYGVAESWTQLHVYVFDMAVQPLGFSRRGEILWVLRGGKLIISTDLEDAQAKYVGRFENASSISSCSSYMESIVLLGKKTVSDGGDDDGTDEQQVEIRQDSESLFLP